MTIDKSKTHKAALLYGAKSLKLTTVDTPPLGSHQVQVAPKATGICGTDMHYYQNGRNGIYTIESPLVLGHEAAGEVVAVGSDVHGLKPGDRVAVEPQLACFVCPKCRLGQYNMCSSMRFLGSASARPPASGSLQQLYNHPASLVYRLPDSLSYLEGAMVEPLSVAIHSVRKASLQAGQTVLITGAGAIGLLCASVARISGALRIAMVDVDRTRLEFAKAQGLADATMLILFGGNEGETSIDFSTRMAKELSSSEAGMRPADVAFECSGVESCLNLCVESVATGGRVILVGMGRPVQAVHLGIALTREIAIQGVWRYTNTFPAAIDLLAAGKVNVKPMITHTFPLDKVQDALELALSKPDHFVKCLVTAE